VRHLIARVINKYRYLQGVITYFDYYSEIGRLSYHSTKLLTSSFYNAMQLGEISTRPKLLTENREGINAT